MRRSVSASARFLDRKPGNAAVMYNKLVIQLVQLRHNDKACEERLCKWLETPLAELPRAEIEKTLVGHTFSTR